MQVLIVAATEFEILPLIKHLQAEFEQVNESPLFRKDGLHTYIMITGVGMMHTAFALGNYLGKKPVDLAINLGVAGAYDRSLKLGEVVHVKSECLGDLGVEEANGRFTDIFELGLTEANDQPYINTKLYNEGASTFQFAKSVDGLTVNKVHGHQDSIEQVRTKYPQAQIETMESAAFFHACKMIQLNFLAFRAISNYVEPRNKDNWKLNLAIDNLNEVAINLINELMPS